MNWPKYLVIAFLLAYFVLGPLFYIFCRSMIKNKDGQITIGINSWHARIAYPFRRYKPYLDCSDNFFSYFTKVFFMFFLWWPFIILLETIKLTISLPILFLFGNYAFSDLKGMSKTENPVWLEVKEFHVPTTTSGFEIFPLYILGPLFYLWLVYKWTFWMLTLGAVTVGIVLLILLLGIIRKSETTDRILGYWNQSKIKSSVRHICNSAKRHNYKLRISKEVESKL